MGDTLSLKRVNANINKVVVDCMLYWVEIWRSPHDEENLQF